MSDSLAAAVAQALGTEVTSVRPMSGGDINDAFALELGDGRRVFAKTNARSAPGMFTAEARGLEWLRAADAIRIPRVLAAAEADPATGAPAYLALELITSARPARDFGECLGQQLAALHRSGAPGFGLDHPNFIGSLPQGNQAAATWAQFYRTRRLEPLLARAASRGLASPAMRRGFDRLFADLEDLVGPPEPPARLHGDLWGGNLLVDEAGAPCLIDPAVYGGHREIDLAMMRLFGGFDARAFAAYDEAFPLPPGAADRVPLYQLYPLLVHVCLFGGSYVGSVEAALRDLV